LEWSIPLLVVAAVITVHGLIDVPRGAMQPRPAKKTPAKKMPAKKTPAKETPAKKTRSAEAAAGLADAGNEPTKGTSSAGENRR
jgi:topoisomerase IA-like protein